MFKLFLLLLLSVSLYADRAGPYISAGVLRAQFINNENFVRIEKEYANGLEVSAGAYINENLSVALEFNYLGEYETSYSTNTLSVIDVAVLAHLPLFNDTLDLTFKFGAGNLWWQERATFEYSDTTSALITGVGSAYRITDKWSVKMGVDVYYFAYRKTKEDPSIDLQFIKYFSHVEYQF